MFSPFSHWGGPGRSRTRMPAERRFIPERRIVGAPAEPARDQPWWKEWLGIGTKREWVLVGLGALVYFAYLREQDGSSRALWVAFTTTAGLWVASWLKKRQKRKNETDREATPPGVDAERG